MSVNGVYSSHVTNTARHSMGSYPPTAAQQPLATLQHLNGTPGQWQTQVSNAYHPPQFYPAPLPDRPIHPLLASLNHKALFDFYLDQIIHQITGHPGLANTKVFQAFIAEFAPRLAPELPLTAPWSGSDDQIVAMGDEPRVIIKVADQVGDIAKRLKEIQVEEEAGRKAAAEKAFKEGEALKKP